MTASQLAKMRAGREAAALRRRHEAREATERYLAFVRAESAAYEEVLRVRDREGRWSDAAVDAELAWRKVWTTLHAVPTDAQFAAAS